MVYYYYYYLFIGCVDENWCCIVMKIETPFTDSVCWSAILLTACLFFSRVSQDLMVSWIIYSTCSHTSGSSIIANTKVLLLVAPLLVSPCGFKAQFEHHLPWQTHTDMLIVLQSQLSQQTDGWSGLTVRRWDTVMAGLSWQQRSRCPYCKKKVFKV